MEGTSYGTLVIDGSMAGVGLADEPVELVVEGGHLTSARGGQGMAFMELLTAHGDDGTNVAELGIGTNEKAILTGNILEDEKILGTCHVAFGASAAIGGTVQVPVHLDAVVMKPTVELDGEDDRARGRAAGLMGVARADRRPQLLGGSQRAGRRRARGHARRQRSGPQRPLRRAAQPQRLHVAAERDELVEALVAGAQHALDLIDLRSHQGLHPHIGALDVCPAVWVHDDRREDAVAAARSAAEGIAALEIPVFLYGELATEPERARAGLLPQGRPGRAGAADGVGRAGARLRPGRAAPERRRDPGHRPPAAGRLQPRARHPEPGDRAGGGRRAARGRRRAARGARAGAAARRRALAGLDQRPRRGGGAAGEGGRGGRRLAGRARRPPGRGRAGRPGARGGAGGLPGRAADPRLRPRPSTSSSAC